MWAWCTAFGAWTTRACPIPSARRLRTGSRRRLRLLDEHCRVYQYLLKRTVGPFVAAACQQPIANEAIQRRAAYLNGRRDDLYDLSLYLVLLYEAPHVARRSTELRRVWQAPRQALRAWLSPDARSAAPRIGVGPGHRDAAPQGAGIRGADRRVRTDAPREAGRLPLLPRVGELRAGRGRRGPAHARHAPRLLRLGFGHRLPPRSPPGRRPRRQGAVDEGAAEPDVRVPAAGPVRDPRRVHRLPRMAAHPQRSDAAGRPEPPPALLQQARVDRELRVAGDPARGDAGRRLREHDGPAAWRRAHGAGGPRPLLRRLLARRSCCTARTRARCSTRPPRR